MTTTIHAVYRDGAFRPTNPVQVPEGTEVELTIKNDSRITSLADALDEIANLPPQGPQDGFSGADHDKVLYPERDPL